MNSSVVVIFDIEGDEQTLDISEEGTVVSMTWRPTLYGLWCLWRRGQKLRIERVVTSTQETAE
jgi:hypothetical protein